VKLGAGIDGEERATRHLRAVSLIAEEMGERLKMMFSSYNAQNLLINWVYWVRC
jgi:hypothetical protein